MIVRSMVVAVLGLVFVSPAWAHECPSHMEAIDEALVTHQFESAEDADRVHELRDKGEELHEEGDHEGSVEALKKAREILDI